MTDFLSEYRQQIPKYESLSGKVANLLSELLAQQSVTHQAVSWRAKSIESFKRKIERKQYENPMQEITDLSGIRIICYVESDVRKAAKIVRETFAVVPEHSGDKSDELGVNAVGYRSVHFVARLSEARLALPEFGQFRQMSFEVQIRTVLQHAWAEIEHDRNYKFSGVLPDELQRRFALMSGMLEVADREFDNLSTEIDKYANQVSRQTEAGQLDIPITSTSVREYLSTILVAQVEAGLKPDLKGGVVIGELHRFGINELSDLETILPKSIREDMSHCMRNSTFTGVLRDVMMIHDADRYFGEAWEGSWRVIDREDVESLIQHGLDIHKYVEQFGLEVSDE